MEANEIISNEEVTEVIAKGTEQSGRLPKGMRVAAGIGIAAVSGWIIYKYAVKTIYAKIKAKKAEPAETKNESIEGTNSAEISEA